MAITNEIIKNIYETYYAIGEDTNTGVVSSHWKHYSERFDVRLDKKGILIALKGEAFGELVNQNLPRKFLSYLCIISYLIRLPDKKNIMNLTKISFKVCKLAGYSFTYDCFRQVCSLALIKRYKDKYMGRKKTIFLVIGDGYGFLSSLIKSIYPEATLVLVDIGKTLIFQAFYCQKIYPKLKHIYAGNGVLKENLTKNDFIYCPADRLDKLVELNYDIAINIASFQEMQVSMIERYFSFLRKRLNINNLFYCCNREYKKLVGGEVTEFKKYPWNTSDKYLEDGYCPWYVYFFSFSKAKILGIRIPVIKYFDGRILHRLTILSKVN